MHGEDEKVGGFDTVLSAVDFSAVYENESEYAV
jgi:hypothetical protein